MPRNIALLGAARSGKDTVAKHLEQEHSYMRIAFADPLKEMALSIDPLIPTEWDRGSRITVRLSALIEGGAGWEYAKDHYPEVRRTLQRMGQTVRDYDPDFWLLIAFQKAAIASLFGVRVVVSDVRYLNEAQSLERAGFTLVRITRPDGPALEGEPHDSETELADYRTHHTITNDGSIPYLRKQVDTLTV